MKKKATGIILSTAMAATLLAGAALTGSAAENQSERTLRFYHWRTEDKEAFETLARNYEEMNPGLTIEIEIVPTADYISTWLVRANGGELDDVFAVQPDGTFGQLIKSGQIMPLNDCEEILSHYTEDGLSAGTRDGNIYAVPQTTNALAIYYNKDIFNQYGLEVPATEEEFLSV